MHVAQSPRPDRRKSGTGATGPETGDGASPPETTRGGTEPGRAGRGASERPEGPFHDLFRGLRAGDLETVLLTVAMAAEENRMPSADPEEERRILGFLARLAEHDAALPPSGGSDLGPGGPRDGTGAGDDGAPDPG